MIRRAFLNNRTIFVEVVAIALAVFVLAVTIGVSTGAPTGSVADWVAAISTFAAFIAAGVAAGLAGQTLAHERALQLRRDEQEQAAQASKVASWITSTHTQTLHEGKLWVVPGLATLYVQNGSQLPIYDVRATYYANDPSTGDAPLIELGSFHEDVLAPHDAPSAYAADMGGWANAVNHARRRLGSSGVTMPMTTSIEFTDVNRQRWIRDIDGVLWPYPDQGEASPA